MSVNPVSTLQSVLYQSSNDQDWQALAGVLAEKLGVSSPSALSQGDLLQVRAGKRGSSQWARWAGAAGAHVFMAVTKLDVLACVREFRGTLLSGQVGWGGRSACVYGTY